MDKEFADLRRGIEGVPEPEDKEISRTMAVLIMATSVGPNAERLAEETGYPKPFIDAIARRMEEAGLWKHNIVDDLEWRDAEGEVMGERLFAHALVALGRVKRHKTVGGGF